MSGTNATVGFAISAGKADTKGLLGFAVERIDPEENERYFMPAASRCSAPSSPSPDDDTRYRPRHPVQSFVWDDFTAEPGNKYEYVFHPLRASRRISTAPREPVAIRCRPSRCSATLEHDVFFNRGVASSQAYAREFDNKKPDDQPRGEAGRGAAWLSRDLDDALLRVHRQRRRRATRCSAASTNSATGRWSTR